MITPSNIAKHALRNRRRAAIRKKLRGTTERPRLVVFRSLKHIYAQIIDDSTGRTLTSASSRSKDIELEKGIKKTEQGFEVGKKLGEKAIAAGISKIAFDRAGYKYHGRVKALAEGARKAGLDF
ncbi:MAG TPA: 50S ribosomal protein L18 [Candidatus Syntrophosphaera sp.]|jgi:large subunit ribosomal protein L18|nr:50S ribosomal protein L18 [Candidatus Cloacimonadota bacterium]OQB92586.1 MAG: 50S ribosomal protein L18 [Candidatus Cloacimonetes bacterium ADurb.Bin117]HNU54249.1 50S ribosomal protein L18 [Candidatus Syntrophosphaera sp.]MDI9525066.1 50S ribosomal protein L18 [Candidatus Cloacimonadota bacterium]NLH93309.1 50S ribosomal protein L18 [Candidatus Cloacimonadota bacterium]